LENNSVFLFADDLGQNATVASTNPRVSEYEKFPTLAGKYLRYFGKSEIAGIY
jgi:hypothetical protein